ncbi:MAG TPA: AAA family ATPase [Verrucomicrobiae bacterium]|nr:AAA family ATPase [Verrucomicrobiae bacterium]
MKAIDARHYLIEASINYEEFPSHDTYPFNLSIVEHFTSLEFHPKVTFIVGENGSGKSTLLESLAIGMGFNAEGGSRNFHFSTKDSHSELHNYFTLVKGIRRPRDGYFLRAESFYNVASEIERLDEDPEGGPPITSSYGGISLHEQSHGESFISPMEHRFRGNGLYILDEPEAALSPARQFKLITLLHQHVSNGAQFIIATHSPIIMGYPDADIYLVGKNGMQIVNYEDTEHYRLTKRFLDDRHDVLSGLIT